MKPITKAILFIVMILTSGGILLYAQDDMSEYSLSVEDYLNNALPLQEGRMVNYNGLTGILTVTDTPSNQRLIRKLINQFDVGPKQVLIEAKFVEVEFENLDELGVEWDWYKKGDLELGNVARTPAGITLLPYKGIKWDDDQTNTFPQTDRGLDLRIVGWEGTNFLTAYIRALASQGRANLLSSPKVATLSGQQANIQVTQTIPYISDVNFENSGTAEHPIWKFEYTIEEKITGITLEVTPYVSESSDMITLEIHPEVSNLKDRKPIFEGASSAAVNPITFGMDVPALLGWPVIDTRTAQTSVIINSGSTVVMGGFIQDDDKTTEKKVPILGDLPIIGSAFRYKNVDRKKKNMIIFLTATLINAQGENAIR